MATNKPRTPKEKKRIYEIAVTVYDGSHDYTLVTRVASTSRLLVEQFAMRSLKCYFGKGLTSLVPIKQLGSRHRIVLDFEAHDMWSGRIASVTRITEVTEMKIHDLCDGMSEGCYPQIATRMVIV